MWQNSPAQNLNRRRYALPTFQILAKESFPQNQGIIRQFKAVVNPKRLGYDVTAFILVEMSSSEHYEELISHAEEVDEVLECHSITGEGSHIFKVRTHDTSSLESLLREIQSWPGVTRTHTMVVMSTFKEDTHLKL